MKTSDFIDPIATIAAHAERAPHAPAIIGERCLDYAELHRRIQQLAGWIRGAGVGPDEVVGVLLPRGESLLVSLLGVLASGGAYTPLDPATPPRRLSALAGAARLRWVMTDRAGLATAATLPGVTVLDLAEATGAPDGSVPAQPHPDDLAYVVFTSGSTGEPKPVAVPHRALANHAAAIAARYRLGAEDRVLQFSNPTFDVLVEEVFPSLAAGAAVVLLPDALILPTALERHLATHEVTVVNLPTPYWTQWARELEAAPRPLPPSLRLVVIGSETGYAQTLRTWRRHSDVPVINAYGLSETTVTATTALFGDDLTRLADPLPIGRAIDGGRSYVFDDHLRPVAPGEPGQLYLGGSLLARGYLHRPELTADRFVPDPWGPAGTRLYRTGDVVREIDGELQFLGRDDGQVKIRSHRVEPLEVAAALTGHPEVLQAHVEADRGPDGARLVAYLVPRDEHRVPTAASVRRHLEQRLPHYMIPAVYMVLDALPCLPSGKVDRAGLPPAPRGESATPHVAARTPLEERLVAIWCDVLGVTRLGVNDDLFALGGHSLTAIRVAARIHAEEAIAISLAAVLAAATVAELAETLTRHGTAPSAPRLPVVTGHPRTRARLSRQQEQVWFLHTLAPDSIAYHAQTTIRVAGTLDLDVFDQALTELARRHAILRTTYTQDGADVWQVVHEPAPVHATRIDLSAHPQGTGVDERHRSARAEELVRAELHTPFDLGQLPLMRWTILILGPAEYEIILVEHHLVHDGWSFALLMRELKALYNAYAGGLPSPLPEPTVQYHDFATWQRDELARGEASVLGAQVDHWRKQLAGMPAPLTLHPDRPRPTVQTYRGETLRIELPPHLPAAVRAFCRSHRVTLFSAMYAAFVALLHRYTGEEDVCIGSAYANRQVPGTHDLVGMFVNAVVLRCEVTGQASFAELAVRARDVVLDAAAHQELPFTDLVRELNPHRDTAAHPLTHVLFSVNDSPLPELDLAGATGTIFERGNGSSKTDLDVVVIPRAESQTADAGHIDDRILLLWEYNRDLFDESTMRAMAERYLRLLEAAVGEPDTAIADLPLVGAPDRRGEVDLAASTRTYSPVAAAVLARAAASPGAVAVEDLGAPLTYGQLAGRARALAAELTRRGVEREEIVAVLLPRGAELVVAELGVLLSGAGFAPLDVGAPAERTALCCADARVRFAITAETWRALLPPGVEALAVPAAAHVTEPAGDASARLAEPAGPAELAYVIYTSGSTGTPKGVMVEHGALANLVGWHLDAFSLSPADRVPQFASPAFDVSIGEIWASLAAGATLVVPDDDLRLVPARLADWLGARAITVADLPTGIVEELLAAGTVPDHLRLMLTGGDRLTTRPPAGTPFPVVNAYGPTEATVTATYAIVASDGSALPDIGRPIPGTSAHVLDARLRPVPPGIPGELYLCGRGLARGYLHRPALTAQRFVPDPQGTGARLYRTGDLVRRTPAGALEFLGRIDEQIKLRGYRIEPGEITAALRADPSIAAAHVAMVKGQLVAYLVTPATARRPDPTDLRERLTGVLPSYMIPSGYVFLDDALPLTRSGKIDHRRLPPPPAPRSAPRPMTGDTERALAEIWREVLGKAQVGPDDNFFDLGGHSLLLGRVHQRVTQTLRPDLPMIAMFQYPTVSSLARYLDAAVTPTASVAARADGRDRLRQLRARR